MNQRTQYLPIKSDAVSGMRLVELPGVNPPEFLRREYNTAYALWHQVWKSTFLELNGSDVLYADDFTRQEDVVCLFEGDQCLLLTFFRVLDVSYPSVRNDSYFKVWPESAISALSKDSNSIVVWSYITVAPEARGNYRGLSLKRFIGALGVKYFLESRASSMTATSRNGKGINTVCADYGSRLICPNLVMHGVPVDISIFHRSEMGHLKNEWDQPMNQLWERRISYKQTQQLPRAADLQRAA